MGKNKMRKSRSRKGFGGIIPEYSNPLNPNNICIENTLPAKLKLCKCCFERKRFERFSKDRQAKDGLASWCTECKRYRKERVIQRAIKIEIKNRGTKREGIKRGKMIWENIQAKHQDRKMEYKEKKALKKYRIAKKAKKKVKSKRRATNQFLSGIVSAKVVDKKYLQMDPELSKKLREENEKIIKENNKKSENKWF